MTDNKLANTIAAIDALNSQDPNTEQCDGQTIAKELLYGQRMSTCLDQFDPNAPEVLQIAARAQHIQRWKMPRADYPMTRVGYRQWRTELGKMHADVTAQIMAEQGYSQAEQDKAKQLLTKTKLKADPLVQSLEDVICLVFLEHYLTDFASKHERPKLIDIIQKTWKKMSDKGHEHALKLPLSPENLSLVQEALA